MTPALRLRCARSHLAAITRMVEVDAGCTEVLRQLRAVDGSLRAVARLVMRREIERTFRTADEGAVARLVDELGRLSISGPASELRGDR